MGEASFDELPVMLDRQRRAFLTDGPPSVAVRRERIDRLMALLLDNTDAFVEAMDADYGTRSEAASLFTEVVGIISVVEHTRCHVEQWMRPTKLMRTARLYGLRAEVQPVSPAAILPRR
jgi:coniferyl-aldehyde dehydrogenase